jgi:hypothetical protein
MRWIAILTGLLLAAEAWGGQIHVKGEMLEGTISEVSKDGLLFTTEYGSGDILVPWADIDKVESERQLVVMYGDDGVAAGALVGVDGADILVGSEAGSATRIPTASIFGGYDRHPGGDQQPEPSGRSRRRKEEGYDPLPLRGQLHDRRFGGRDRRREGSDLEACVYAAAR